MDKRKPTRKIKVGSTFIGGDAPILIQSMCATKTTDITATAQMSQMLFEAGGGLIRIAVDNLQDAEALIEIRQRTSANLSVDLQENYKMAEIVAPFVDKIRYNPGHLHHLEPDIPWQKKVEYLAQIAQDNDCALRIGVNCGSIDPLKSAQFSKDATNNVKTFAKNEPQNEELAARFDPLLASALEHSDYLESLGFIRFCVSIKDSDPLTVLGVNRRFSQLRPLIPLHLGVTEAGMPPLGVLKSRIALEPLLSEGIGDTLRVSLTVPNSEKIEEIRAGMLILKNVAIDNIIDSESVRLPKLNIVSCPSCSRVQNSAFVELAQKIQKATEFAQNQPIKIAVMGCRVNGPGETDDADIGLWCGPNQVNLKDGKKLLGSWPYDQIIEKTLDLLKKKLS